MNDGNLELFAVIVSALLVIAGAALVIQHSDNTRRMEEIKCYRRGGVLLEESGGYEACVRRDAIISWHNQSENAQ